VSFVYYSHPHPPPQSISNLENKWDKSAKESGPEVSVGGLQAVHPGGLLQGWNDRASQAAVSISIPYQNQPALTDKDCCCLL
jgi:hypothetical protein